MLTGELDPLRWVLGNRTPWQNEVAALEIVFTLVGIEESVELEKRREERRLRQNEKAGLHVVFTLIAFVERI